VVRRFHPLAAGFSCSQLQCETRPSRVQPEASDSRKDHRRPEIVFWEKMLTARHQARLWDNSFYAVFPNTPQIPDSSSQNRADLRNDIEEIRKLRNRIAHHEPIFTRVLRADLDRMVRAVRWRCDTTADWLLGIDPVTPLLAKMP